MFMKLVLALSLMGFGSAASAHHCSYQNHKVVKYQAEVSEWQAKVDACKLEQETDDSTTCYWEIKRTAKKQDKLDFWGNRLENCLAQPHCSLEKHKVIKYEGKVAEWDAKVEACKIEQETDDSTTCYWEIKKAANKHDKLDFWNKMLERCES